MQPVHCSPSAFGLLLHRNRSLALLSAAGLPSAAPANPFQRLWPTPAAQPCLRQAGAWGESPSPATSNPSQRLWPTPASQPCLRQAGAWGESPGTCSPCSYGLPKATLGILQAPSNPPPRLQTLPSAFGLLLHRSLALLLLGSSQPASSLLMGFQKATSRNVQPLNPPRTSNPPAPLAYSCIAAALPASGGSLGREPLERAAGLACSGGSSASGTCSPCTAAPAPLAYSCIATAALPSSSSRQLAGLPLLFPSKSDVRHFAPGGTLPRGFKPFPAPLAYSCSAALPASGGSLGREPWNVQPVLLWASKSDVRHFAPPSNPPPRLQTLPSAFGLLLHRSLALFLFSAARRPASSLLMGFQKRR